MYSIYEGILIVSELDLPLPSHSPSQSTVTRAQVRVEIVAAGRSGQHPQSDTRYPEPASDPVAVPHVPTRSLIQVIVVATVLVAPVAVFAQANQPVTRAQVRAELIQLEKAGYNPAHGQDPYYPADIQAAEAKVAAQNAATGVGGVAGGSSDAGRPAVSKADWNAMYNHP